MNQPKVDRVVEKSVNQLSGGEVIFANQKEDLKSKLRKTIKRKQAKNKWTKKLRIKNNHARIHGRDIYKSFCRFH